jgi:hypothetical protein
LLHQKNHSCEAILAIIRGGKKWIKTGLLSALLSPWLYSSWMFVPDVVFYKSSSSRMDSPLYKYIIKKNKSQVKKIIL